MTDPFAAGAIRIGGARQHNLQNIHLTIPRHRLVVFTGVSGSGKSSLAFDTLYAEGQRRYVESLSVYARQFLDRLEKPDVDFIEGLSPAIAIEQRTAGGNPRSTIATTTEIYDYLRLLFAHAGIAHHPQTGRPLQRLSTQQIADHILAWPEGTAVQLLAPVILKTKGEFRDILDKLRREGFLRARVDGTIVEIENLSGLDKNKYHTIEAVVDRLKINESVRGRLGDSLETALRLGQGIVRVLHGSPQEPVQEWVASNQHYDAETGYHFGELSPRHFSFNNPQGACPVCLGLGTELIFDEELVIADPTKPLAEMPIDPWQRGNAGIAAQYRHSLESLATHFAQPLERPWAECSEEFRRITLHGSQGEKILPTKTKELRPWAGVLPQLADLYNESKSELTRQRLQRYMSRLPCRSCHGARLKPEILAVTIQAGARVPLNIYQLCQLTIEAAAEWMNELQLSPRQEIVAREIVKELRSRLGFLREVGLSYLTLDRESGTLSGGEAQRIRLATQIGSRLTGVLYILDEPSIGLHQRDNDRLLLVMKRLRDLGNSVVVVEHDEDTIMAADYVVDIGPAAGPRGGRVVAAGTVAEVMIHPDSLTGRYLSGAEQIRVPRARIYPTGSVLRVIGAREHNLKNVTATFPLGLFTCVTGVSGSGKSTLVNTVLSRALFRHIYNAKERPGQHDKIEGLDYIDKVVVIDQTPIGRTPRSNPLSYSGAFNPVRDLFAQLPSSRVRGYATGRFSFNVAGGRCEHCEGGGLLKIEMNFLPPVYITCEHCHGRRFNRETLEITYKGRNIADVLDMTVDEGLAFFRSVPAIQDKLAALAEVGLGYVKLGQQATTLSGGEAQRIKLAAELAKKQTGRTVYIMDEPTTGLHWADIELLLQMLYRLRDSGNTLIVIEHNLHVIKCADHVIDLGPEGGRGGGQIVVAGTPEAVAACAASQTGHYLRKLLGVIK
jgi:excinuclease ABC subunit A